MAKLIDDIPNMTNRELTDILNGTTAYPWGMDDEEHNQLVQAAEDELWDRQMEAEYMRDMIDHTENDAWAHESEKLENIRNEW